MAALAAICLLIALVFMLSQSKAKESEDNLKQEIVVERDNLKEILKSNLNYEEDLSEKDKAIEILTTRLEILDINLVDFEKLIIEKDEKIKQLEEVHLDYKQIREDVTYYTSLQEELYDALLEEFREDLPKWNATLEKDNTIRFNEPEILFELGLHELKERFCEILDDFFPRYLDIVYAPKFRNEIEELRIEGHTCSIWNQAMTKKEIYLKNSELSQARATSVMQYCMSLVGSNNFLDSLVKDLRVNGLAFAKLIKTKDGQEDRDKSRRVEFRVVTKTHLNK